MKRAVCAVALLAGIVAGSARADGLPIVGVDVGPGGVSNPRVSHRWVALPSRENTLVARIEREGGRVERYRTIPGRYTIPAVAYDGSAAGLSTDGSTLVLIAPRLTFPRPRTTFALLDAGTMKTRERLTLRGDFSFDAMSPDGRWVYLIHYTSSVDPLQYEVRALDAVTGRLDPKPIVDPREPDEAMNGHPLTRATSPDGRWAYTLYEGTEHPFIHALDTVGRSARCIDLDWLHGRRDLWGMRFALADDGRELTVRSEQDTVAVVDTGSFQAAPSSPGSDGSGWTWLRPGALGLAGILAALALFHIARARRAKPALEK